MVVNLCLPHFQTTPHCNKLCADGCDVSNLLSADPATRQRGFKLEYFVRPPLHVTLHFQVKVHLCRVDVELWPWGMDQGCGSKRLEIFTCSDLPSKTSQHDQENMQFKLVGRCELRGEVLACFKHPNFKLQASFPEPPPEPPAHAKLQELWSRGPQSLSSVAQLRLTVPYGGAASALGFKSLAVWGVPANCCPPSDLENFQKAHFDSLKPNPLDFPLFSPVTTSAEPSKSDNGPSEMPIPEEFLDPLTQELMVLPMILPSGMVVDNSTLEEYQKREATWGRLANDPFTGVSFTNDSKPIPNQLLKSRIDSLMLRTGCTGVGSRNAVLKKPLPSRLIGPSETDKPSCSTDMVHVQTSQTEPNMKIQVYSTGSKSSEKVQEDTKSVVFGIKDKNNSRSCDSNIQSGCFAENQGSILRSVAETCSMRRENLGHSTKRKSPLSLSSATPQLSPDYQSPLSKMSRTDASVTLTADSSQASHEQRLSDSLDQALTSALHGLPSFTLQSKLESDSTAGQNRCGSCSCSLTVYSKTQVAYSLPCGHLLCRSCLHREHPPSSQRLRVTCPSCKGHASPSSITRVHL